MPEGDVVGAFEEGECTFTLFGDGTQQRAFTYVGDIAPVIAKAPFVAAARNEVFNIGADIPYSVNHLAERVARAMGVPGHAVVHFDARKEVHIAYANQEKARTVFGEFAETSLDAGLTHMAAWARSAGSRCGKRFEPIEVERNLPPSWRD